jgi:WD40 repeat protein
VTSGEREIYLVGPSGSGKSSLVQAGVMPRLRAQPGAPELVLRTMRPGDAPVRHLAECLEGSAPDAVAVASWAARHPGARLVVFIDQLEELFAVASAAEQVGFATALRVLRAEPRCLLVLAVRADFYAELMQSQLWLDGTRRHVDLPPLQGDALREAIVGPARALDVYLESDLIERLLADAADASAVLPLLQATLEQLWRRRRLRRLITIVEYEALGEGDRSGLAVAISSRADRCLREMEASQVVIARRTLLRLVSFGEGRPNTRRRQTRTQLAAGESPAAFDAVLRRLVAARLVTMHGDRSGDDQVDLCHDVLITAWPSFATWVETRRADELRRRQIQASADEWMARGRGASGLLDEGELATALTWRRTDAARELGESDEVTALIDASRAAVSRRHRRRLRAMAAVGIGLVVFAAVVAILGINAVQQGKIAETERGKAITERNKADRERENADRERRKAVYMLGEQYRERGRRAVVEGAFQRAIPYLVAARARGVDDVGLKMLFRIATTSSMAFSLRHDDAVTSASFSADGKLILTSSRDGTARLWNAASGEPHPPLLEHTQPAELASISEDGSRVVVVGDDTAWIWDVTRSPPQKVTLRHGPQITTARFSTDGTVIVTASSDRTARLWDAATGNALGTPLLHRAPVLTAELNRDASRVVTTVSEGTGAAIWDARTGARIASLDEPVFASLDKPKRHLEHVWSAAFSRDGTRAVTTGADHTIWIWDAATGSAAVPPIQHPWARYAVFSPDGTRIAAAADRSVRFWNAVGPQGEGITLEHPARVLRIDYSRDGKSLLTRATDHVVRVWDVASGTLAAAIDVEAGARRASISPDGARVVTASPDGVARVWLVGSRVPRTLATGSHFSDARYSPDGSRIAATDTRGRLWIGSVAGTLEPPLETPFIGPTIAFDRDGEQLAVMAHDGATQLLADLVPTRRLPISVPGEPEPGPREPRRAYFLRTTPGSFSPDGRSFATTGARWGAGIWNIESGKPISPWLKHNGKVRTIRFSSDGSRVVTASLDGTARVWDVRTGEAIRDPLDHQGAEVLLAEFSPDGARIVTSATDHRVRLWDTASHRLDRTLTGHTDLITSMTFSATGARLVTASHDRTVRIWDVGTGALAAPALDHESEVLGAALSRDGTRIVTISDLVQIWDARTARPLARFASSTDVSSAAFSPDGKAVVTAGKGALRIWDTGIDKRTLEDWQRIARAGAYPQLVEVLARSEPAIPQDR